MSRRTMLARIILWALILVILTGAFVGVMRNEARTNTAVADAEEPVTDYGDTAAAVCLSAAEINEIDLSWVAGSVEITTAPGDEIVFSEDYSGASDKQLRYEVTDGVLAIRYCENRSPLSLDLPSKRLTLTLPETRFTKVRVELTSAELSLSGTAAEQIEITSVSGGVRLEDVRAGDLTLGTTSGKLTLTGCEAQSLRLSSVSGAASAEGVFDSIKAGSTSGAVKLTSAKLPQKIDVSTVSGDVTVTVPRDSAFRYDYGTVSGDVHNGLADAVEGKDAAVTVNTVSGGLRLEALD